MDFFEYASIASSFVTGQLWVSYLVGGLCFAVVYIFQAMALYTIAQREGFPDKWMAFVPFFNTYYIGVCGQKNRTFRTVDTKKIAIAAGILEAVLFVGYMIYNIALARLDAADCFMYTEEETVLGVVRIQSLSAKAAELSMDWEAWCYNYLDSYILFWLNLAFIFMEVLILSAFFQTYASRRYFLFTITSIFLPIQGILFFVVRNNRGQNYREFMYAEQARQYNMYRQYQQRQNPYNNPYDNSNNPYANPPQNGQNTEPSRPNPPEDPFGNMGNNHNDDPFS